MTTRLNNRVLKLNVGYLMHDGPAHSQDSTLDIPALRVADDLDLDYLRGPLRLTRTKEGILVQAQLKVGMQTECYRCLDTFQHEFDVVLEELYAVDPRSEQEFSIGEDGILDLAPLLRAEIFIVNAQGALCRPDCQGLCAECGTNLNHSNCTCADDAINPQFAALKKLLDSDS